MSHVHPDIVVGEPIPEIGPTGHAQLLGYVRKMIQRGRMVSIALVLILIAFDWFGIGLWLRMITLLALFAVLVDYVLCPLRRRLQKQLVLEGRSRWPVPFRLRMESFAYTSFIAVFILGLFQLSPDVMDKARYYGVLLIGYGVLTVGFICKAKEPCQIGCKYCNYLLAGLRLPCACPECGELLVDERSTTDHRKVQSRAIWCAGLGLILLGGSLAYSGIVDRGLFLRAIPRSTLLMLASTDQDAFSQMISLELTESELQSLIEMIIEKGDGAWYLHLSWLEEQVFKRSVSSDQLERLFEQIHQVQIDSPEKGRVGLKLRLQLSMKNLRTDNFLLSPVYSFDGFKIEDKSGASVGVYNETIGVWRRRSNNSEYWWRPTASDVCTISQ